MYNLKSDAVRVLAEVCIEQEFDVIKSFKIIKEVDDLLGIIKLKNIINHSKGRKSNKEKRFDSIFKERLFLGSN